MQIYNRRRAGEIEKVLIEDYKCYKSVGEHIDPEVYNSLSETGKEVPLLFFQQLLIKPSYAFKHILYFMIHVLFLYIIYVLLIRKFKYFC